MKVKQIVKIGFQDNDIPVWLTGEISEEQLDSLITFLEVMRKKYNKMNSNKAGYHTPLKK